MGEVWITDVSQVVRVASCFAKRRREWGKGYKKELQTKEER